MLSKTAFAKSYVEHEYACPFYFAQKRTLLMGRPVRYCSKGFNEELI